MISSEKIRIFSEEMMKCFLGSCQPASLLLQIKIRVLSKRNTEELAGWGVASAQAQVNGTAVSLPHDSSSATCWHFVLRDGWLGT